MYRRWNKLVSIAFALLFLLLLISVPAGAKTENGVKNVLFIILDALRADHLGCYGYHRNTSPNIDRLARRGIVFDRVIVQAGWTKPSMASYFTSVSPAIHKVVLNSNVLSENLTTMAEVFSTNGYSTFGFINNPNISSSFGFNRGFNVYRQKNDADIIEAVSQVFTGRYLDPGLMETDKLLQSISDNNELKNYGFETGLTGWKGSGNWVEDDIAHSGCRAVHISQEDIQKPNFYFLQQRVVLTYGRNYLFGAFVRTRGLKDGVTIEIKEGCEGNERYINTEKLAGDSDWTLLWQIYKPRAFQVTTNTVSVEIRAGRAANLVEGEFWVDDVFILPLDALPPFYPTEKLFIYLHLLDPHAPYEPPSSFLNCFTAKDKATLVDKYDAEIRTVDSKLGILFEGLESLDLLKDILIIITSDHGEAFGEHGMWQHGAKFYYDEVARVPLIFYNPVLFPKPERVEKVVRASNLLPSLVDLLDLDLPPPCKLQGSSYFQKSSPADLYACLYECPRKTSQDNEMVNVKVVSDGRWKYISNEYYSFLGPTRIRGINRRGGDTNITIVSPHSEDTILIGSEEELKSSDLFKSLDRTNQEKVLKIYRACQGQEAMLFDLQNDPGEKNNVINRYPGEAERLRRIIRRQIESDSEFLAEEKVEAGAKAKIPNDIKKQLRALGYLN